MFKRGDRVKFVWNTLNFKGTKNLVNTQGVVQDYLEQDELWPASVIVRPDDEETDIVVSPLGIKKVDNEA